MRIPWLSGKKPLEKVESILVTDIRDEARLEQISAVMRKLAAEITSAYKGKKTRKLQRLKEEWMTIRRKEDDIIRQVLADHKAFEVYHNLGMKFDRDGRYIEK
ncbi:MAG: hypothetical protein IH934_07750 [Nanoarchaeota archaeon]|nr:hypothetical protein [Nanoarchaeota archaeon]